MSLRVKLCLVLLGLGVLATIGYTTFVYHRDMNAAMAGAEEKANNLIMRSVEMFMVSTRKFHSDFERTAGNPEARGRILDDWNRTIFAVDEAVIHDFGEGAARVRLIGDEEAVGYPPLGANNTRIEIPFERNAVAEIKAGAEAVKRIEDGTLRVAVPLMAQAHPGCAECHYSVIEGDDADMSKETFLGTLNAYVPLDKELATARTDALVGASIVGGATLLLLVTVFVFINRFFVLPINAIAARLTGTATDVAEVSGSVASASQALAMASTEQAAGLEETSSSLEEMASMTQQNADNAQQAHGLSQDTKAAADFGTESMSTMETAIERICGSAEETARIIKVIDEIAFQTNLLALNAAVEAARAGEAGKGFAVVAEEVRNLAMRSAEAARNTAGMIEESVNSAREGVDLVRAMASGLAEINGAATKVNDLVSEIAAASREQATGVEQVNKAVGEMDRTTQSSAANAEQTASAASQLEDHAEQLKDIVNELNALVGQKA